MHDYEISRPMFGDGSAKYCLQTIILVYEGFISVDATACTGQNFMYDQ